MKIDGGPERKLPVVSFQVHHLQTLDTTQVFHMYLCCIAVIRAGISRRTGRIQVKRFHEKSRVIEGGGGQGSPQGSRVGCGRCSVHAPIVGRA